MGQQLGRHAIVIGASFAGLCAARALAPHFEQVSVLDRDVLPDQASARAGVPQGRQVHALLAGGLGALEQLVSGFEAQLCAAGAERVTVNQDLLMELPGFDPFPRRDLGFHMCCATRPLFEQVLRAAALKERRVQLEPGLRVRALACEGGRVLGVHCESPRAGQQLIAAELTVDASGSGELTLQALEALGMPGPEVTSIGVEIGYATALFEIPEGGLAQYRGIQIVPQLPHSTRGALMLPVEGGRWQLSLGSALSERPPADASEFLQALSQLRTPSIARALAGATPLGEVSRFGFTGSRQRHFERLSQFPRGLLVVGDAICRFNPVYGQGLSVAAQEGLALAQLLDQRARAALADPLDGLGPELFARCAQLIETPWELSALPDLLLPSTRGVRPADLRQRFKTALVILQLAARDPEVHLLHMQVTHLLRPRGAYFEGEVGARIREELARRIKT